MKRKNFILLVTAGAAALAIPTWYYKYRTLEYNQLLSEPELLSHIWETQNIMDIGRAYQQQFPDEASERTLVNLLVDNLQGKENLTESLQQQIVLDYQQERIVMIDGWFLSITEARQCALFSIAQSK